MYYYVYAMVLELPPTLNQIKNRHKHLGFAVKLRMFIFIKAMTYIKWKLSMLITEKCPLRC